MSLDDILGLKNLHYSLFLNSRLSSRKIKGMQMPLSRCRLRVGVCDVKVIIVDRCGVQPRQIWDQTNCIHPIFPGFSYFSCLCFICSLLS